jgi:hypothetical protein
MKDATLIQWPAVNCQCVVYPENCICSPCEMALRAWGGGFTQPMTPDQREFCLSEIDSVEGFRREDHESDTDQQLARATLDAWLDYCRDKGLL